MKLESDMSGGAEIDAELDDSPLVPEASPPPDPVLEAIARLPADAGAMFESPIRILLSQARTKDPARWARYRQAIKDTGVVSMPELDRLTRNTEGPEVGGLNDLFPEIEPCSEPVDGAILLNEIAAGIRKHVVADLATINAVVLWIVFTWFIEVVDVAPIANITAPEKRCGKSVLLAVMSWLVYRPLPVSNISPAALFRVVEQYKPTLLIDEVDTFLQENEVLRGILNAGHTRESAFVLRCEGDDHALTCFGVFGAKVLCGIGRIADTLFDRAIPFILRRKLPGERITKIRYADRLHFKALASKLARFALDNQDAVRLARPAEIDGLNDRANDCMEPLLAIAEAAGGDWPKLARNAAIALYGVEEEAPSIGAELLADVKAVLDDKKAAKIFSADLLAALIADQEAPWTTWNHGKPMVQRQLTAKLKAFGIQSKQLRIGSDAGITGYERSDFNDAFKRYLPAIPHDSSSTTLQPNNGVVCSDLRSSTIPPAVENKKRLEATNGAGCRAVENKTPPWREKAGDDDTAEYF
ncbi:DUF3631 domain-containing protein [Pseudomonas umsongensis]|uniref:DUF3631 domain-containing protein n=1 Tax=Pseudomonas umsongensis TaxID=198618 RepID=UPI003ECF38F8